MTSGNGPEKTTNVHRYGALVKLSGDIDLLCHDQLKAEIKTAMDTYGHVIIDLQNVRYMDSMGIGALATAPRTAAKMGYPKERIVLTNIPRQVVRVLLITNIGPLFAGWDEQFNQFKKERGEGVDNL